MIRFLAYPLILVGFSSVAIAQLGAGLNCELMVRVRTASERIIETPVQVEVLVPQGVLATMNVIGDGTANFQVTSGKNYRLRVSGTGFQTVTTAYFGIESLEQEHTETVHLIADSPQTGTKAPSGQATVSVSELNVPKNAGEEMKKGLDAYSKGDSDQAANHLEKATVEYPQFARAYDLLAAIAMKSQNRGKARELLSKAIEVDGTYLPAFVDLARIDLQEQLYTQSESLLEKAISINPNLPEPVALLATAEFVNKQYDKALSDVQRTHALPNHEQFAEVHLMAAKVLRMQNHPEAAIVQFRLFLKEKPDSPQADAARKALASLESPR